MAPKDGNQAINTKLKKSKQIILYDTADKTGQKKGFQLDGEKNRFVLFIHEEKFNCPSEKKKFLL